MLCVKCVFVLALAIVSLICCSRSARLAVPVSGGSYAVGSRQGQHPVAFRSTNGGPIELVEARLHRVTKRLRRRATSYLGRYAAILFTAEVRLFRAKSGVEAAALRQAEAERSAFRLFAYAKHLRLAANAATRAPTATVAQLERAMTALRLADMAERDASVAQREADLADSAFENARAKVEECRLHVAAGNIGNASREA